MTASQYVVGGYQASEGHITHKGRTALWDGSERLIIVCHGRTPSAVSGRACLQWTQQAAGGPPHLLALAERGYAVMCIDAGGNLTWGNQASETAVDAALTWARDPSRGFAHPTKKALLVGYSMGGAVATNYANNHPNNVVGLLLESPGVDIGYFHANGYASEIDSAYPTGYTGRDPMTFASNLTMSVLTYAVADDTTVPPAIPHAFHDALPIGNKTIIDLPSGGHTNFWVNIDQNQLNSWVDGLPW